jgi:hypothetical protein
MVLPLLLFPLLPHRLLVAFLPASAMNQHVAEYRIISKDLIRLIVLNGLMLAAVLVVYFTNRNSGYLERIFSNLVK